MELVWTAQKVTAWPQGGARIMLLLSSFLDLSKENARVPFLPERKGGTAMIFPPVRCHCADSSDEEISVDGVLQLMADLQLADDDIRGLILAWKCGCKKQVSRSALTFDVAWCVPQSLAKRSMV